MVDGDENLLHIGVDLANVLHFRFPRLLLRLLGRLLVREVADEDDGQYAEQAAKQHHFGQQAFSAHRRPPGAIEIGNERKTLSIASIARKE
jgi:hypothetical protein